MGSSLTRLNPSMNVISVSIFHDHISRSLHLRFYLVPRKLKVHYVIGVDVKCGEILSSVVLFVSTRIHLSGGRPLEGQCCQ